MQQDDGRTIAGAGFGVADIQDTGVDLLQRAERRVRPRLDPRDIHRLGGGGLCVRAAAQGELSRRQGHSSSTTEAAAIAVDVLRHIACLHL